VKSLKDMIVTLTQLGVSSVSLTQSGNQVRVTAMRKHPLTGRIIGRLSKEYPSIQLRGLVEQIAANSYGMYMIGWNANVEFANHAVTRVSFMQREGVRTRHQYYPELSKALLAAAG